MDIFDSRFDKLCVSFVAVASLLLLLLCWKENEVRFVSNMNVIAEEELSENLDEIIGGVAEEKNKAFVKSVAPVAVVLLACYSGMVVSRFNFKRKPMVDPVVAETESETKAKTKKKKKGKK